MLDMNTEFCTKNVKIQLKWFVKQKKSDILKLKITWEKRDFHCFSNFSAIRPLKGSISIYLHSWEKDS